MPAARPPVPLTPVLLAGGARLHPSGVTASGMSLPCEALQAPSLRALRPGGLLSATLRLEGPEEAVEGRVVARLLSREAGRAEFAFLVLPVHLRRPLEEASPAAPLAMPPEPGPRLPDGLALAFARLEEPLAPGRRLILPESAPVHAISQARRYGVFTPPDAAPPASSRPKPPGRRRGLALRLMLAVALAAATLALTLLGVASLL